MSNKHTLVAMILAWSSVAMAGPTIAELSSVNAELKMQELQNKLDEAKNKHAGGASGSVAGSALPPLSLPSTPTQAVPVAAPISGAAVESEDIRLEAIYGVGENLKAEVLYNGNTFTLSKLNGNTRLGSWTVQDITPYRLILSKPAKHGKKGAVAAQKEVYLSSNTSIEGGAKNLNLFASPTIGAPIGLPPVPATGTNLTPGYPHPNSLLGTAPAGLK